MISGYAGRRALIISDPEEGRYCIAYDDMRRDNGIGTWTKTFAFATSPASRPRCHVIQEEIPGAVVGVAPTRDRIVCEGGLGADATREGLH